MRNVLTGISVLIFFYKHNFHLLLLKVIWKNNDILVHSKYIFEYTRMNYQNIPLIQETSFQSSYSGKVNLFYYAINSLCDMSNIKCVQIANVTVGFYPITSIIHSTLCWSFYFWTCAIGEKLFFTAVPRRHSDQWLCAYDHAGYGGTTYVDLSGREWSTREPDQHTPQCHIHRVWVSILMQSLVQSCLLLIKL